MADNTQILPQYTLDQLTVDVCQKLDFLKTYYSSSKMWDGIMEHVTFIEQEPRNVNSVIVKVIEKHSNSLNNMVINYHTILTRSYVLLYYRHRDDAVYQALVFPKLLQHMGIYSKGDTRKWIDTTIDKILETDALVAKAKEEQRKNVEPLFRFVPLSGNEADMLYNEYCDERLFREMISIIKSLNEQYNTHLDEAIVWYNAKQTVLAFQKVSRPEMFIERAASGLVMGQINSEYQGSQIILLCVYGMVRSAKEAGHFSTFVHAMENLPLHSRLVVIRDHIAPLKKFIDMAQPFNDYNYLGQQPAPDTFTKADIERIQQEFGQQLSEAKEQFKTSLANAQKENSNHLQEIDRLTAELEKAMAETNDDTSLAKDGKGFTVGQYSCLLYAAAQKIEDEVVKDKLKILFSKITGYSPSNFNKKLMGNFSEKDKDIVSKIIETDMPRWAELVRKL